MTSPDRNTAEGELRLKFDTRAPIPAEVGGERTP